MDENVMRQTLLGEINRERAAAGIELLSRDDFDRDESGDFAKQMSRMLSNIEDAHERRRQWLIRSGPH